jgi:hypothetical protein
VTDYWSSRLARRIEPANVDGNMGARARIWRGLCDWSWGIRLETPIWKRCLWVWRRLT